MKTTNSIWSPSFAALIFIAIIINIGVSAIIPAMPLIMMQGGLGGQFLSGSFIGLLIGRLISSNFTGMLLVKRSPTTLLLLAFALHALTMCLFLMVWHNPFAFMALRFLEGVFEGIVSVTLQLLIIALSTDVDRGRKMGIFQSSYGLGFILGPALGGMLLQFGGADAVFGVTAGVMVIGLIWLLAVRKTISSAMSQTPPSKPSFNLEFLRYLPYYGGAILQRGLFVALSLLLPLFLVDRFHLEPYQVGLYFTTSAVITTCMMPIGGRVADSSAWRLHIIWLAMLAMGLSIVGFALAPNQSVFTVCFLVETVAFSFMVPASMRVFGDRISAHPQRSQIVGAASSSRELLNIAMVLGLVPLYYVTPALPWALLGVASMLLGLPYLLLGLRLPRTAAI